MLKTIFASAAVIMTTIGFAAAHDYSAGKLKIVHPMAFETAKSAKAGAGYMAITNDSDKADRLVEVRAEFPRVEIHNIEEKDGIASMIHMEEGLDIPANKTTKLSPGGFHVMFMGLDGGLELGTEFPATLVFENAGEVEVVFKVEERTGDEGAHDHSNHNH
ncbi:MAG: copper chaperone PCu(A)C [Pseudomonadota bacterium]